MPDPTPSTTPLDGTEPHRQAGELQALRRLLVAGRDCFSLSFALCNSPALRDRVIAQVSEHHPTLRVLHLPTNVHDVFDAAASATQSSAPAALFIVNLEESVGTDNGPSLLRSLNASRELWASRFPCPVVFWVPEFLMAQIPSAAPDLWRYRSHTFDFTSPLEDPALAVRAELSSSYSYLGDNLSANEKRFRMAELQARIHAARKMTDDAEVARFVPDWLLELGHLHLFVGEPREAERFFNEALQFCRKLGDRRGEGNALGSLGNAHAALGDARTAIEHYEQVLTIAREIGDRRGEGNALGNLGLAHADLGDARTAIEYYEQVLTIAREIGDRRAEGSTLGSLGNAHAALGDARTAIGYYEQHLTIAREIGDRRGEGNALGSLGIAHFALGDARAAIEYYEQHLTIAREIGDRRGEENALGNLGNAHFAIGDARKAIEYHEQALKVSREIGDRRGEGQDLGNLGIAHFALGDARTAIAYYEQRLVIAREIGDRRGEGNALGNLGNAHAALGDARTAIGYYEQRLVIAREIGDRRGEGNASFNRALLLAKEGRWAEAADDMGRAAEIFAAIENPGAARVAGLAAEYRKNAGG